MIQSSAATDRMNKAKRYLRLFMRDTAQLNRLLNQEEADDEMYEFAIDMVISDWNTTTPVMYSVSIANYPSLYLLLHGAAIQLLKSNGLLQARNQLTYQSGGSAITRFDKSPLYQAWMTNFASEYEIKKKSLKIQQNIGRGWGGVESEYSCLLVW